MVSMKVSRVIDAMQHSEFSDYTSSNGTTWDKYATTFYFYETSDKYMDLMLSEYQKIEYVPKDKEVEFSEEFANFIARLEAKAEAKQNTPIGRNYKTRIPFSYHDKKTGKKVKKYIDLKELSDDDLRSMSDDIPEALYEILYRSATENNTTNK